MEAINIQFSVLQDRYRNTMPDKRVVLERAWERMRTAPQDPAGLKELFPLVHRLAGGVALILMQATSTLDKGAAYTLLLRQLAKTVEAIAASHRAAGDAPLRLADAVLRRAGDGHAIR